MLAALLSAVLTAGLVRGAAASAPILGVFLTNGRISVVRASSDAVHDDGAAVAQDRESIVIGRKRAPCYCSRPLTLTDPAITRAIIVIHGSGRDAAEYYETILDNMPTSADSSRDWRRETIVLAPHFQEKKDASKDELWWEGDWSCGGEKKDVSSFAVVDTLVARLRNGTFPNLKWIVITGHSAGGQFVQRYAAFTDIDLLPAPHAALVKFVPSNPSSYVYLNDYRFDEAQSCWVIPPGKKNRDYDDYKYGLDDLDDYAKERGPRWAQLHLPKRRVEVLAGTADTVANDSFDDSREAMWQGHSRYERALRFGAFMDRFYPENRLDVVPVPNVGHDHRAIYASEEAKRALYFED